MLRARALDATAAATTTAATAAATATAAAAAINFKDLNVDRRSRGRSTNTESGTTSTIAGLGGGYLINAIFRGINRTRNTITISLTNQTNTKRGQSIFKRTIVFQVNRVPANLNIGISISISISTSHIWRPITHRGITCTPNTSISSPNARRVNIIMSSSTSPIRGIRNSNSLRVSSLHLCGDEHRLVAGQHCLTKGHLTSTRVFDRSTTRATCAVVGVRERFFHGSVGVTVKTTVHGLGVSVAGGRGIPLQAYFARRAGVRAVASWRTFLVG